MGNPSIFIKIMNEGDIRNYYGKEVCEAIWEIAKDREVGCTRLDGSYLARPAVLNYKGDVTEFVKRGSVSFHGSIERWNNPMELAAGLGKKVLDSNRKGWDFVIDIDCDQGMQFAKISAEMFVGGLKKHGLEPTVKYSGNRGFHIGVPFEAFPEFLDGQPSAEQYPGVPKRVAEYLKDYCREPLAKALEPIVGKGKDPYAYIDIDIGVFSSRHMFRLPYCLHTKTWLVSLPIKPSRIMGFDKRDAEPGAVEVKDKFLERDVGDASKLVRSALFWCANEEKEEPEYREFKPVGAAVSPENFPPCIKKILEGLEDGKKRSVFVLTTFLLNLGWGAEEVKKLLLEWNRKNPEPIGENFLLYTLRDQLRRKRVLMCPNCESDNYYQSYGVCIPDRLCKKIKNPAGYSLAKQKEKRGGKKSGKANAGKAAKGKQKPAKPGKPKGTKAGGKR